MYSTRLAVASRTPQNHLECEAQTGTRLFGVKLTSFFPASQKFTQDGMATFVLIQHFCDASNALLATVAFVMRQYSNM